MPNRTLSQRVKPRTPWYSSEARLQRVINECSTKYMTQGSASISENRRSGGSNTTSALNENTPETIHRTSRRHDLQPRALHTTRCDRRSEKNPRTLKIRFTPLGPATNSFRVFVTSVRPLKFGTTNRARYRPQSENPERPVTNKKGNTKGRSTTEKPQHRKQKVSLKPYRKVLRTSVFEATRHWRPQVSRKRPQVFKLHALEASRRPRQKPS